MVILLRNMNLYAFELGRKKDLCFAELISVLGEKALKEHNFDTAIFALEENETSNLQNRLGGTIKIVEIFAELPFAGTRIPKEKTILENIQGRLENFFKNRSGKIPFAVCLLNFKNPSEINIKNILNFSKKILKSLSLNSRFVNTNLRENPPPSTIFKAKVLEKGIDLNLIKGKKSLYLGQTIAIQDIDSYSKRDYGKPYRDARVGMTPPKLAQIMINLALPASTIYDPFCGTGTILMEALLMGKNTVGSDIDKRLVFYSKENITWLKREFSKEITQNSTFRVFEKDAQFLDKISVPKKIDAIVTEAYLGPPVSKFPDEQKRIKIFQELTNLHKNWLKKAKSILEDKGKIVLCLPAFKDNEKTHFLPYFNKIAEESGFKIHQSFIYDRPDQVVAREIVVLTKK